jgi:hypothetical protein
MPVAVVVVDIADHLIGALRFEDALWVTPRVRPRQGQHGGGVLRQHCRIDGTLACASPVCDEGRQSGSRAMRHW